MIRMYNSTSSRESNNNSVSIFLHIQRSGLVTFSTYVSAASRGRGPHAFIPLYSYMNACLVWTYSLALSRGAPFFGRLGLKIEAETQRDRPRWGNQTHSARTPFGKGEQCNSFKWARGLLVISPVNAERWIHATF